MKHVIIFSLFLWLLSSCGIENLENGDFPVGTFDYAILNGSVIDGTGNAEYRADILIRGDSIAFIGNIDTSQITARIIDASNLVVTPGFIDAHAHGAPFEDSFENFLSMGVTTILLGQDGRSPVHRLVSPSAFFDSLENHSLPLNMAFLAGHGDLREALHLSEKKSLEIPEIEALCQHLEQALDAGCLGLSTGLEYLPGALAQEPELTAMAKTVGSHGRILMSHLRSEDDQEMNNSIEELLNQGKFCRVHISHIKVVYGKSNDRAQEILAIIEDAQSRGIQISTDVYPYNASYTGIGIVFPEWAKTKKDFDLVRSNRETELRSFIFQKIMDRNGPEATLFATRPFTGKTLAEVASESGQDFVDILLKIGPVGASGAYFVMNEALQETFIVDPDIMISSDGGPSLRHPRSYGSFSKIIEKYVVNEQKLSLEAAIHKMSGLTASRLPIADRGILRQGFKADILVFNPTQIQARSTYANPYVKSKGLKKVFINGSLVIDQDSILNLDSGKIIKSM
ncbi:MAG: hypothetical protein KDC53_05400 [Saprospiraceae bacterium]|nr:hypothetical protein [Saprospiraceae bacterium]